MQKLFLWLKTLSCDHTFNGSYNISASRLVVEINCDKCKKLHSWTFSEWDKLTNSHKKVDF